MKLVAAQKLNREMTELIMGKLHGVIELDLLSGADD